MEEKEPKPVDEKQLEAMDVKIGWADEDFNIAVEYTCPACKQRRSLVLKDTPDGASIPCECGEFAFVVRGNEFAGLRKQLQSLTDMFGKRR